MRAVSLVICLCLTACGDATPAPLVATDIVLLAPLPGQAASVGYLSLGNHGNAAISITRVASESFESVEMHESLLEHGVAKMRRIQKLTIPAHSDISFEPGGKHLMMLHNGTAPDVATLDFYDGETLLLRVTAALAPRIH